MIWRVGKRVRDRWWPWRLGIIRFVGKTRVRVEWQDTREVWSYDHSHLQFLEAAP